MANATVLASRSMLAGPFSGSELDEPGSVATQLSGFIRVCRVLDLAERFGLLVPEPVPSPVEQLKLRGRRRQRASAKRKVKAPPKKWQWGDEQP